MKLITRNTLAAQAAKRWKQLYSNKAYKYHMSKQVILARLTALGENPNPDDVDKIIGNNSFTRTKCNECGLENIDVVQVWQEPNYASYTANICKECLKLALNV